MIAKLFVLSVVLAVVLAAPADNPVSVLKDERSYGDDGSYKFSYELDNGEKRDEHGIIEIIDNEEKPKITGSYSFVEDGVTYTVNYVADHTGFHPQGAHIPVTH